MNQDPAETARITRSDLLAAGWPQGLALGLALALANQMLSNGLSRSDAMSTLGEALEHADASDTRAEWRRLRDALLTQRRRTLTPTPPVLGRTRPYPIWGADLIDPRAIAQMDVAMSLPVSTRGALMPDAHVGYGLPIGGVLETKNVVIPYAVGSDIACRMRLTVLDMAAGAIDRDPEALRSALVDGTVFGAGRQSPRRADSAVLDEDWAITPQLQGLRDLAGRQLGTSGSGNHFVEWGEISWNGRELLGLMSHSGSRGVGFKIASHYSDAAEALREHDLPKEAIRLSWLDFESDPGREYWHAMQLAGMFASENHRVIHERVIQLAGLGSAVLESVENHHNFAWAETDANGDTLVVHRKGATPAGRGVMGLIPGSMATHGYVVSGKGNAASLSSASHGAGRAMGRRQAERTIDRAERDALLAAARITLIGGGLDESPQAYKPIEQVIAAQADLVDIVATFTPRIVRMDTDSRDI
jgi:tRNA-splicing ligase RtcB